MKMLFLILSVLVISCSPKLEVPIIDVKLVNQQRNFILGTNELKVVITSAQVNPKTAEFTIKGYTDFLMVPDPKYVKDPHVCIKRIRNNDTTVYGYTGNYGKFKIKMYSADTIFFDYDQYKLLNVYFHYP